MDYFRTLGIVVAFDVAFGAGERVGIRQRQCNADLLNIGYADEIQPPAQIGLVKVRRIAHAMLGELAKLGTPR